jgi:hypothetical protein
MDKGQRTPRLLQLSKTETTPIGNYFKNGKPVKPIDEILGEIYDTRIKPQIGKPSFMEKLKADIASNQESATIPSMTEDKAARDNAPQSTAEAEDIKKLEQEASAIEDKGRRAYEDYWRKNPKGQATSENNNIASFLTAEEQSRLSEIISKLSVIKDKARGTTSIDDIKEIVRLKRALRNKGIDFNINDSKEKLQSLLAGVPAPEDGGRSKDFKSNKLIGKSTVPTKNYFAKPDSDIQMPELPQNVLKTVNKQTKPVVLKKNIAEKNLKNHPELLPEDSELILKEAIYSPTKLIQDKPKTKPDYWVFVKENGKNKISVIELSEHKDSYEIIGWRYTDKKGLENIKKRAEREGGQVLITNSEQVEKGAADLSALTSGKTDNINRPTVLQAKNKGLKNTAEKAEKRIFDKAKVEQYRKELFSGKTLFSGLDPEVFGKLVYIGGYHLENVGRSFAKWSKAMIDDLGERIKPHLDKIWAELTNPQKAEKTNTVKSGNKKTDSVIAKQLASDLRQQDIEVDLHYTEMHIAEQVELATALAAKNPAEAERIALGAENKTGINTNAIRLANFYQAKNTGDWEKAERAAQRVISANIQAGQDIVVNKGFITDNSPIKFVKKLATARMEQAGKRFGIGRKESGVKKTTERIRQETKKVKEKMTLKQMKIQDAQKFIESLRCK